MLEIAVIDDDSIILEKISELIDRYMHQEKCIYQFNSGVTFINSQQLTYDVVFLDIDMPDINGFEIAEKIKFVNPSVIIIFVSNMEHLVFNSFKYSPFRFVRKNNLDDDMKTSIIEYEKKLVENNRTFLIKTNELEINIPIIEIIFFESQGHDLYAKTIKHLFKLKRDKNNEQSIRTLTEQISNHGFIRVHKSFLVNYKYIYKIKRNKIVLKDNSEIDMNPHNASEIKQTYNKYLILEV